MDINPFKLFERAAAKVGEFLQGAPEAMGQLAVRESLNMFRQQAFIDAKGVAHPWPGRKVRRYRRLSGKGTSSRLVLTAAGQRDRGRALLVKSGRLKRSLRVVSIGRDSVTVGSDVVYAQAHNEGTQRLPQRQFIGDSKPVSDGIRAHIQQGLKKIFG